VLVVGAGSTGLAAALELARNGVRARIVDRAAAPTTESRGTGLQPRTLELLDLHGIGDELMARGQVNRALAFFRDGREVGAVDFSLAPSRYRGSPALPQSMTEEVLRRTLAGYGIEVEWDREVVALAVAPDGVTVQMRGGEHQTAEARCAWLVAADGAGSTVRRLLGVPFDGVSYPERWGLMDADLDWPLTPDRVRVFRSSGSPEQFVTVPLGGRRYRLQTDGLNAAGDVAPTVAEMQDRLDAHSGQVGRVANPGWTSTFRVHRKLVQRYRSGRVLLAGDAAHVHTPAGAQGLNTGIQDAFNLAWKLAAVLDGLAPEQLIDSYESERRPVAAGVLGLTEGLARDRPELDAIDPEGRRRTAAIVSQCAISYRDGPLGEVPATAHKVAAGDRLPDVTLSHGRLYEALRPGGIIVALLGGDEAQSAGDADRLRPWASHVRVLDLTGRPLTLDAEALPDPDGAVRAALGMARGVVVIRPDAYLAAMCEAPTRPALEALDAALGRLLQRRR
jgi:2-polyprenyl-6-methoxyphenol hydroxylase-like FAD-dependent oxidoreductase